MCPKQTQSCTLSIFLLGYGGLVMPPLPSTSSPAAFPNVQRKTTKTKQDYATSVSLKCS